MFDHHPDRHVRGSVVITTMVGVSSSFEEALRRHPTKDAYIMVRGYMGVRHMTAGEEWTWCPTPELFTTP